MLSSGVDYFKLVDYMYCFVADLSGFQNIIRNLPLQDQDKRVAEWIKLIEDTANGCQLEEFSLIADTIVLITNEDEEGIEKLINFIRFYYRMESN